MERSEPSLVPQWLKNTGSQDGGGSVLHSDDHTVSKIARNKSFVDSNGNDFKRSHSLDKTKSSYFRWSSTFNSSGHLRSRSSFGRNQHGRDWERVTYESNKDKSLLGDENQWQQDLSDFPGNALLSKFERDGLRWKHGDTCCNKVVTEPSCSGNNTNWLHSKGSPVKGGSKVIFERDFPSLRPEEKVATSEVGRVPSPGLTSAIQNFPIGSSTNINGEKWTSALVEGPVLVGSNGAGMLAVQHEGTSNSVSLHLGATSSLNMAEAVAHGPIRAQTTPQLSAGTQCSQRLEELAIKQSRQLIPMKPSSPKTLVLNSADKQKARAAQQQHAVSSSLEVNHSPCGGPVKSDALRATNIGKLHVLNPVREKNIATPAVMKDNLGHASGGKLVNSPSVSGSPATRTNPCQERKPMSEKRPTSQAQSRNDFFNSVRKKSMADSSSVVNDTSGIVAPSSSDQLSERVFVLSPNPKTAKHLSEMNGDSNCNDDFARVNNSSNQNKPLNPDPVFSEEEEAAFLRSLGWEENADEGGLTEEEINAFFQDVTKYINSKHYFKIVQGVQPKFLSPNCVSIVGLNSPDAKLESS